MMKIGIHYFSGCGNTAWVAVRAQKYLTEQGHEVVLLQNIEQALPTQMPSTDVDLFLSPVYFFGLPANVIAYYKRLPMVAGRKALFWAVCGKKQGATSWGASSLLKDRGYEVISTNIVQMPDTFLFLKESQMTPEERRKMLSNATEKIKQNIEVLTNLPSLPKGKILSIFSYGIIYILYLFVLRHTIGLTMVANSKCTHCGLCAEKCPTHAIRMKEEKPQWQIGCVGCLRCLNNCPIQAIDFSMYAVLMGLFGALAGLSIIGSVIPLGFISKIAGLLLGWIFGCFIYQKISSIFSCDKMLILTDKKRIPFTDEESLDKTDSIN